MDRGAWQAIVNGATEMGMTEHKGGYTLDILCIDFPQIFVQAELLVCDWFTTLVCDWCLTSTLFTFPIHSVFRNEPTLMEHEGGESTNARVLKT